jgi:hypothetical protein
MEEDEQRPLLGPETGNQRDVIRTGIYTRRWGVLIVFCYACVLQSAIRNTWGAITESSEAVFGWSDGTIGMMANWGSISQLLTLIPQSWLMDKKGTYTFNC